jgi:acyl-CoA reductase-like NAD-dependent aldehyde dehydrogenase
MSRVNMTVAPAIAGTRRPDAPGGRFQSVNPARTAEVAAEVTLGDASTFLDAATAARAAQPSWADLPAPVGVAEAHLPFGGNGKSGNGSRQSGLWVLVQFTRWQSLNWDYSGSLQKAHMDVAELKADESVKLGG